MPTSPVTPVSGSTLLNEFARCDLLSKSRANVYPFVAEDQEQLRCLFVQADSEATKFEKEILRMKAVLGSLEELSNRFRNGAALSHSLLSPIRKLPQEVLSIVFSYVAQGKAIEIVETKVSIPILPCSHVCKFWRDVALSTRSLWNCVRINAPKYQSLLKKGDLLGWIVARSGKGPLDVQLGSLHWRKSPTSIKKRNAFLNPLISSSNRFTSLVLEAPFDIQRDYELYEPMKDRLSSLQSLSLSNSSAYAAFPSVFGHAPSLTDLTLNLSKSWSYSPTWESVPTLPWKQLLTLSFITEDLYRLYDILHRCSRLTSLKLIITSVINRFRYEPPRSLSMVTIVGLEDIHVGLDDRSMVRILQPFNYLQLPSLKHIRLETSVASEIPLEDVHSFDQMIRRSGCRPSSLSLVSSIPVNFLPLLGLLPTLESLHIEGGTFRYSWRDRNYFDMLLTALQDPICPILPNLRYLSLRANNYDLNYILLLSLLHKRYNLDSTTPFTKLESTTIEMGKGVDEQTMNMFQPLIENGLKLQIHTS